MARVFFVVVSQRHIGVFCVYKGVRSKFDPTTVWEAFHGWVAQGWSNSSSSARSLGMKSAVRKSAGARTHLLARHLISSSFCRSVALLLARTGAGRQADEHTFMIRVWVDGHAT